MGNVASIGYFFIFYDIFQFIFITITTISLKNREINQICY